MGNRYYPNSEGKKVLASVTTITGLADKSDALIPWAVNCAVDYVLKRLKGLFKLAIKQYKRDGLLYMLLWLFAELRYILHDARTKWREVRDEAGHIGTMVHDALEEYLHGVDNLILTIAEERNHPDPVVRRCAEMAFTLRNAAVEKLMALGPYTVLATEQKVVNEDEWYAGRFDALLEVDGETWLIDFKTGASFYPEWGMQLAAYAEAADVMNPLRGIDRIKVLRLDKRTLKAYWKEYGGPKDTLTRDNYMTAFRGLRDAFYVLKAKKAVKQAWIAR